MRLWNSHWSFDRKGHPRNFLMQKKNTCQIWQILLASIYHRIQKNKKITHNLRIISYFIANCIVLWCFDRFFFSKLLCKLTNKTTTNNKKKVKDKECAKLESSHSFVRVTQFVHEIQIVCARTLGRSENQGAYYVPRLR